MNVALVHTHQKKKKNNELLKKKLGAVDMGRLDNHLPDGCRGGLGSSTESM